MAHYIYGIDIGGTAIKFGLFDETLTLLEKWEIPTVKSDRGIHILQDIVAEVQRKTPDLSQVIGYGFGVPGPVIKDHIGLCANLGWNDLDIREELRGILGTDRIHVANDANTATLGEALHGAGHGRKNVAMITLGTGVGSGIIVDGEILEGAFGAAGEIGHLTIPQDEPIACNCGKSGCLETVASATGIRNLLEQEALHYVGESVLDFDVVVSAKDVFDAAQAGDRLAMRVVDKASFYIAYACHVVSVTTNPSVILIGGGVSKAGEFLLEKVRREFDRIAFPPSRHTRILQATLGNDAGIYGAAELVRRHG
jgi:glucokinase